MSYRSLNITTVICLFVVTAFFPDLTNANDVQKKRLYIHAIKLEGLSKPLSNKVRDGLKLSILENYGNRYYLLDDEAVKVIFSQIEKTQIFVSDDQESMASLAKGINADELLYGSLSMEDNKMKLTLSLIERNIATASYNIKSMASVSFQERKMDYYIAEAAKKIINSNYEINENAYVEFDSVINLKTISHSKVEGIDIPTISFQSNDDLIGSILTYFTGFIEEGDSKFKDKNYEKAKDIYLEVLNKIQQRTTPEQRLKLSDLSGEVKERISSTFAMQFKDEMESADTSSNIKENSSIGDIEHQLNIYQNIQERINKCPSVYAGKLNPHKKALNDRVSTIKNILSGMFEKQGDIFYREYNFSKAMELYDKAYQYSVNNKNRYSKKKTVVKTTAENYLKNKVKSMVDQASFYNIKDQRSDAKTMMKKTRKEIMDSEFATTESGQVYNKYLENMHNNGLEAMGFSAIVPGLGQAFYGDNIDKFEGALFFGGTIALSYFTYGSYKDMNKKYDDYNNLSSGASPDEFNSKWNDVKSAEKKFYIYSGSLAGLYIFNIIDAFFAGRQPSMIEMKSLNGYSGLNKTGFYSNAFVMKDKVDVVVGYRFCF